MAFDKQIPINFGDPAFEVKIDLDDVPYTFAFKFNDRLNTWHFDILDDAGEILLYGVPFFINQLMIEKYQHDTRLPQGELLAINIKNNNVDADRGTIGEDVLFLYQGVS